MIRIIAGEKKGMRLVASKSETTRPTLGRVRESLFMILHDHLEGARVLDLFAGSGGLILEALSRGAASGVAVECSHAALTALRSNLDKLRYRSRCEIVEADVIRWLARPGPGTTPYDLILLDPPYGENLAHRTLDKLADAPALWLALGGIAVAQVGKRDPLEGAYGTLVSTFSRTYGETRIEFFQRVDES